MKLLKKPIAAICFDVNSNVGLDRFVKREKLLKRIEDYDINQLEENFIKASNIYEEMKKKLFNSGIKLIKIDGNKEMYDKDNLFNLKNSLNSLANR